MVVVHFIIEKLHACTYHVLCAFDVPDSVEIVVSLCSRFHWLIDCDLILELSL